MWVFYFNESLAHHVGVADSLGEHMKFTTFLKGWAAIIVVCVFTSLVYQIATAPAAAPADPVWVSACISKGLDEIQESGRDWDNDNYEMERERCISDGRGAFASRAMISRLEYAQDKLETCQLETPTPFCDSHDGLWYRLFGHPDHCGSEMNNVASIIYPANRALGKSYNAELAGWLSEHVGGQPENWPMSEVAITEMGYR